MCGGTLLLIHMVGLRQEDFQFEASVGYIARLSKRKKNVSRPEGEGLPTLSFFLFGLVPLGHLPVPRAE